MGDAVVDNIVDPGVIHGCLQLFLSYGRYSISVFGIIMCGFSELGIFHQSSTQIYKGSLYLPCQTQESLQLQVGFMTGIQHVLLQQLQWLDRIN